MKTISVIIILILHLNSLIAQKEDHTWYFSNTSRGLFFDYNTYAVSATNVHSAMIEAGSYFVASDNITGQLLFYSDGTKIFDSNHQIMPNGNSLTNAPHSMQTGLVCYFPGQQNKFIIFNNTSSIPSSGSVYYSIIDMSLPGNGTLQNPKGDIVSGSKNLFLTNQCCEGMYIIKGSGNFYWLVIPKINTTNVAVYKIDNTGINLSNTFNVGLNVGECVSVRYSYISQKIGFGNILGNGPSFIMDFNETTGVLTNSYQIPGIISTSSSYCGIVDMEWSPNGQFLYLSKYRECPDNGGKLLQYNIQQPSTPPVLIAQFTSASMGLKIAPNGKIYHRYDNYSTFGIINNPDLSGTACNYNQNGYNIGSSMGMMHKFPEFLIPLNCNFYTTNTSVNSDFICIPNDTTHINIPTGYLTVNTCNDTLTYQVINVTYGSAQIIGNNIQYVQPNYYISDDTIIFVACNNSAVCDTSLVLIHLNYIGPTIPIITQINDTLYSSSTSYNQWLLNGNPIPGATNNYYVPTQSGYYSLKINEGLCYAESAPYYYEYLLVSDNVSSHKVNIYPNPVKSILNISEVKNGQIRIYDINGKIIFESVNSVSVSTTNFSAGIYLIEIVSETELYKQLFIKE